MSKPKFVYRISEKTVAHANDSKCLTLQQGNFAAPDSHIFLDRDSLAKLRDAINEYLAVQ